MIPNRSQKTAAVCLFEKKLLKLENLENRIMEQSRDVKSKKFRQLLTSYGQA
jgi:hypothetical protein